MFEDIRTNVAGIQSGPVASLIYIYRFNNFVYFARVFCRKKQISSLS